MWVLLLVLVSIIYEGLVLWDWIRVSKYTSILGQEDLTHEFPTHMSVDPKILG